MGSTILQKKYYHEGEDFDAFLNRVAGIFSEDIREHVRTAIKNADFFPAGRTLYGAGSKGKQKVSMSNCYILHTPEDNIESIYDANKEMARIFSYGGGCGVNISKLRPVGAKVNNSAQTSTGAVSFMDLFNATGDVIGQHGRRAAIMIGLHCAHPDIYEFLRVKQNNNRLESANISILFTDEFMKAVVNNAEYTLKFTVKSTDESIEKTINAREFFKEFAETQWDWGDPGAIFIDEVRKSNLLSGYPEYNIDISNPCFTGDMRILTVDGYKTFEELKNKTDVKIISSDGEISNGKVWCSGNKDTITLRLSNGRKIKCTPNHVFMDIEGREFEAKDMKGKQIMPLLSNCYIHEPSYVFERLGFIQGDGQLTHLKSLRHHGLEVNIGKNDRDILDLFELTETDLLPNGRTAYVSGYNSLLRNLGFSQEALPNREFPITYSDWHTYDKLSFLRGCYSANGSVIKNERIAYKTTCKQFAKQLCEALKEFDIVSYITTNKEHDVQFSNGAYTCKESYDVNIYRYDSKVLFYNYIGFIQSYKIESLYNLLKTYSPKVTSITPNGVQKVYDFTEPRNHWGIVEGCIVHNCSEFFGNAGNSCNLGSINLYNIIDNKFTDDAQINYAKLQGITYLAVQALDEVLDYGYDMQPLELNKTVINQWRSIGLGVFGLADALIAMGVEYGSEEAVEFVEEIMYSIFINALTYSCDLAKRKGTFAKYSTEYTMQAPQIKMLQHPTLCNDILAYGLRNGSLLSIAPTGSISTMCGMSGGIEPLFALSYERTTHSLEGEGKTFTVRPRSIDDLLKHHNCETLTDEQIKQRFPFVITSHEISAGNRIKMQSAMQQYVDNAISSTVNLPNSATPDDIFEIYIEAWLANLKGITVFRDGCKRGNILGAKSQKKYDLNKIEPIGRKNIKVLDGSTIIGHTACAKNLYTTVNKLDGDIFEIFTNPSGGCKSNISTITRLCSLALRSGIKVDEVISELKANTCPACTVLKQQGNKDIAASCGACVGEALEYAIGEHGDKDKVGLLECPSCHKRTLRPVGKCFECNNCGYSKCE